MKNTFQLRREAAASRMNGWVYKRENSEPEMPKMEYKNSEQKKAPRTIKNTLSTMKINYLLFLLCISIG